MSIASEITRIKTNIENAYNEIESKGGTIPQTPDSSNLATTIQNMPGEPSYDLSKPAKALTDATSDIVQKVKDYYDTVLATYIPDTTNPVTIYVPSGDVYHLWKYYYIYYRPDYGYRAVFFENYIPRTLCVVDNVPYIGALQIKFYVANSTATAKGIDFSSCGYNSSYYDTTRYTSWYSTVEELITVITTNSGYSTTSVSNRYSFPSGSYIIYSNIPFVDITSGNKNTSSFLTGLKRISSNETYHW